MEQLLAAFEAEVSQSTAGLMGSPGGGSEPDYPWLTQAAAFVYEPAHHGRGRSPARSPPLTRSLAHTRSPTHARGPARARSPRRPRSPRTKAEQPGGYLSFIPAEDARAPGSPGRNLAGISPARQSFFTGLHHRHEQKLSRDQLIREAMLRQRCHEEDELMREQFPRRGSPRQRSPRNASAGPSARDGDYDGFLARSPRWEEQRLQKLALKEEEAQRRQLAEQAHIDESASRRRFALSKKSAELSARHNRTPDDHMKWGIERATRLQKLAEARQKQLDSEMDEFRISVRKVKQPGPVSDAPL
jgi:hypothetical protein